MFKEKYLKARAAKNSVLCVGLDPIMQNFVEGDMSGAILDFCLDIVEKTSDYACAYKPNSQFLLFSLSIEQIQILNKKIHKKGCISILDHKLGDIGSTNNSALYWIEKAGFDAFTFSPFAGNITDMTMRARRKDLGVFVLTLMSNPESAWVQKEAKIDGRPLYLEIARRVAQAKPSGVVVGAATENVTVDDIKNIRAEVPRDTIFLCPGVGAQGGDPGTLIKAVDGNILINVGRAIINEVDQKAKAKEYRDLFNSHR